MQAKDILPTALSVVALCVSGFSLYESSLKAPDLSLYIAPRIDYVDPDRPEAVREVFILPLTIANDGARGATVMSIDLEVVDPRSNQVKRFQAARLGSWGETPLKPFAPVMLAGKAIYTQALQFEPRPGESVPRVLSLEPGRYRFVLSLTTASPGGAASPTPLRFEMEAGAMDYRMFQGNGTMAMWKPSPQAAAAGADGR
jgi:hypothetical protein